MGLKEKMYSNVKKPEGFLGKRVLSRMNGGLHAQLADWGIGFLGDMKAESVIDLGCGGGRNVSEFLKRFPDAFVRGLDYSETSVAKASKVNRAEIASGRCEIVHGDVTSLPFDDGAFDLVSAFETIYFWPDIEKSFSEIVRVLRPGGKFLIVNESDGEDRESEEWAEMIEGLTRYTAERLDELLKNAGFKDVKTELIPEKHWLCVIAEK